MSNEQLSELEQDLLIKSLTSSLRTVSLEDFSVHQLIVEKKRHKLEEQQLERAVQEQTKSKIIP